MDRTYYENDRGELSSVYKNLLVFMDIDIIFKNVWQSTVNMRIPRAQISPTKNKKFHPERTRWWQSA